MNLNLKTLMTKHFGINWYKEMGTPILTGSGATNTIINTNVAVSDDEPTELDKNVWFDY